MPVILVLHLFLVGCVSIAIRPIDVPRRAVFSGGVKGGNWLVCFANSREYICDVYSYEGRLFERGVFDFENGFNACYPSFIMTDYRYRRGFLTPKSVLQIGQGVSINSRNQGETIESAITRAYEQSNKALPSQITIHLRGSCENGYYEATFGDNATKIRGRIWAGKFFQIWPFQQ